MPSLARRAVAAARDRPSWVLALVCLASHLWASRGYDYFRDELYFIVCGERLDWGFVDQPPLIPAVAAAMHHLFPGSLVMLRLLPALAHGATVMLAGTTARRLGGGLWAEAIAALCVLTGSNFLGIDTTLSTGALEPLVGLFVAYALIRVLRDNNPRWWFAIGGAVGIALQAKYLIAFWLAGLGLGLLATAARRVFLSPHLYAGGTLALLIALPNVLWQAANGWPFIEMGQVAVAHKNVAVPPLDFLWQMAQQFNEAASLVGLGGLIAFAFWRRFADLRLFAVAFVAFVAAMILLHGKVYYLANAVPTLISGGAVALEAWLTRRVWRVALTTAIVAIGLISAPFVLPILPVAQFAAYWSALGVAPHREEEHAEIGVLGQYYADMFGWRELAMKVADIYRSLPPDEQKQAVFLGNNYGEAAAIDVLGRPFGLPAAVSGHNNYFLWGPQGHDGSVVIRLGGKSEDLLKYYASCTGAGVTGNPWAIPYETGKTLWVCRDRQPPMDKAWPTFRHYD
jgi:hypothetical protein